MFLYSVNGAMMGKVRDVYIYVTQEERRGEWGRGVLSYSYFFSIFDQSLTCFFFLKRREKKGGEGG